MMYRCLSVALVVTWLMPGASSVYGDERARQSASLEAVDGAVAQAQGRQAPPAPPPPPERPAPPAPVRGERDRRGAAVERLTHTVDIGTAGELEISNVSGDIRITSGNGSEAKIQVTKRARRGPDAERQLGLVKVDIQQTGQRAEVRTVYPRGERNIHVSVDFDVVVPSGTRVSAKSVSGNLEVKHVKGGVRAETVSGHVSIHSVGRLMLAKSVSGDVNILSTTTEGELSAASISGNLRARGLNAPSLDLSTVSGNVFLEDVTSSRGNIRSVSGNLEYHGVLAEQGRYQLQSHSGDIKLAVGGTIGFQLDANSFSGSIHSDLPIVLRSAEEADRRSSRRPTRAVRGTFGDGGALLEITTFSGNITIATIANRQ
jgi:DUF4097 and DUF4098 domain-containing protein YvlB